MISFLVAFRDPDGTRSRLWTFIRAHLEQAFPDDEIVEASDDGEDPFHKTLALNRAAARSSGAVLAVWDADTWVQPEHVHKAAVHAQQGFWSKAWASKLKLNEAATDHVLSQGLEWDGSISHRAFGSPENHNTYWAGPPIVLRRDMWEAVGGHDERFRGWGSEDESFATSLRQIVGKPMHGQRGMALHLWHTRLGASGKDLWQGQESRDSNAALGRRYRLARTPEQMRALIAERELVEV